jgi:hypothetical protein
MKALFVSVLLVAVSTANVAFARCTGFEKEARFLSEIAKASCKVVGTVIEPGSCNTNTLGKAEGLAKNLVDFWNDAANGGPGAVGPRTIALDTEDHGKLIVPGGRLWIVNKPVSGSHKVTIKYRDGKAGAMVDLCEADGNGNTRYLGFLEIEKKSESGGSKTVSVTDGWLLVDMRGTGFPTNSYSYTIEVDKAN